MKQIKLLTILLTLLPLITSAQEERIDTVIPKYLSNGYFFKEHIHSADIYFITLSGEKSSC